MSKNNNVFNNNKKPAVDPIAQEQADQRAQHPAAVDAPNVDNAELPKDIVQTGTEVPKEPDAVSTEAEVKTTVTETVASKELPESRILKANRQNQERGNTVIRPTGASTREASPEATPAKERGVSDKFSSLMASERKSGTANAIGLISFLDMYVLAMAPRKITPKEEIIQMQQSLHDQLIRVIERVPAKEFNRLWNILVQYVGEYKDACFGPMYFSRGARDWKRDPKQFQVLTSLLNLLLATARDKGTVSETVNIETVFGEGFTEDARGRIFNFYS